jgi:hypothetical protein
MRHDRPRHDKSWRDNTMPASGLLAEDTLARAGMTLIPLPRRGMVLQRGYSCPREL